MRRKLLPLWVCCILMSLQAFSANELLVDQAGKRNQLSLKTNGHEIPLRTTDASIEDAQIRAQMKSGLIAVTWNEAQDNGAREAYFAISADGKTLSAAKKVNYTVHLRYGAFNPGSDNAVDVPPGLAADQSNLRIIQFHTQIMEDYRAELHQLGVVFHRFLPEHSQVVSMDAATADRVANLDYVRWVGPFHPAYKLDEGLIQARGSKENLRLNLLTMVRGELGQDEVADAVVALGGEVLNQSQETYLMTVSLPANRVHQLAKEESVQWIDFYSDPEDDMDVARAFHGADFVESVAGYTGAGVNVEVMDSGCDEGHPDLQNYILHTTNTPGSHGTCTSGIVVGSGANNFSARGMMPDAFLSIADYSYFGNRYNHTSELVDPNGPYRTVLQTNSWGDARTTAYSSISQDMDLILFDHERISILQSQSNAGNQQSRPQAWAKNIISVGGVRHYGTQSKSDDAWAGGASIGPAADGRIKPDLASFYDSTLCTDMVGSAGYASGDYYSSFGGTSGATPIVAGALGLLYQMWGDGIFGNPVSGDAFDSRPANTTAKALLINTSTQWNFSGTGDDLTRVHQGWGHPDLVKAHDLRSQLLIIDETDVLGNLQSTVHSVTVNAGTPELKATMVYRDPAGTTSSSLHRINNMDLKVTSPGGTVYWGNNGLNANMYSVAGGSANNVDTVENVFIQNPAAGTWLVEVIASEINQDTHVETGSLDADYALVVSGVAAGPPVPQDPIAVFSETTNLLTANFDGSASYDPDGTIVSYAWDFGNGNSGSGATPSHTYAASGTYTVSLTVTDDSGATGTTSHDVSVSNVNISLSVNGYKVKGRHTIDLNWSGASSSQVDIYRNGSLIATVSNSGSYTDSTNNRGGGASYTYEVCEAGSSNCSNSATASY